MSICPHFVDSFFRDPHDNFMPILAYREPVVDYPRRSWNQLNRNLHQVDHPLKHAHHEVVSIKDSKFNFEVNLNCSHYKPEEINVKLVDNSLVVEAKHEERLDGHGYISRQFRRRYELPKNIESDKLESKLGVDGILSIKAPKKVINAVTGEKNIPITLTNQVYQPIEGKDKQSEKMETK